MWEEVGLSFYSLLLFKRHFSCCKQNNKASKKLPREVKEMEVQEQQNKSRVVKVDSVESWEFYVNQATNQACPFVVHFTASWCMPSVAMNPFFEELASAFQDVLFLTVDVDDVKEVATRMEIKAMPTFLLMKEDTVVDKLVGANPEEIRKRIDGFVQSIRVYVA